MVLEFGWLLNHDFSWVYGRAMELVAHVANLQEDTSGVPNTEGLSCRAREIQVQLTLRADCKPYHLIMVSVSDG